MCKLKIFVNILSIGCEILGFDDFLDAWVSWLDQWLLLLLCLNWSIIWKVGIMSCLLEKLLQNAYSRSLDDMVWLWYRIVCPAIINIWILSVVLNLNYLVLILNLAHNLTLWIIFALCICSYRALYVQRTVYLWWINIWSTRIHILNHFHAILRSILSLIQNRLGICVQFAHITKNCVNNFFFTQFDLDCNRS